MNEYEKYKQEKLKEIAKSAFEKNALSFGDFFYGDKKEFEGKSAEKVIDINKIEDATGKVTIQGEVFGYEKREIYGGRTLYKFSIDTENGALGCKIIVEKSDERINENVKNGENLKLRGEAQYDKYARELVFNVIAAQKMQKNEPRQDEEKEKRVELHLHTQMSAMDAVSNVKDLVNRAIYWGHKAVAITDHGVVQAFPDAAKAAKGKIKILYGVEGYLQTEGKEKTNHVTIIAKNLDGLKSLYELITHSHVENFYKKPQIPKQMLADKRENLLIGSACELGEVYRAILEKNDNLEEIASFYDYFEIMPLGNNQFMVEDGTQTKQGLIKNNKKIIELADKLNKLVVATGDVHFLEPKDDKIRAILQAGQGYTDADSQAPLYFHNTQEMLNEFEYLDEITRYRVVVENPNKIADMVDEMIPIPDETYPPHLDNAEESIMQMCKDKAKAIYGDPMPEAIQARMDKELEKINKYGFAVMYLIAQKLVAKSNADGYMVGSRGSVGSSFVAFLCGITEVNALPPHYVCPKCHYSEFPNWDGSGVDLPEKSCPKCEEKLNQDGHDIPFETFLGFEGDKEPDIDLNFSGDYQPRAHKYVEELFGADNVFRAGTIATLADRTAFGFVKKYMESRGDVANNATVNKLVSRCVGVKRTTGQHPGGLMILPKGLDIHMFGPVQHPANDKSKNVLTTHFDYHSISGRLLKLDILGHDDPTVIRMLEDITGVSRFDVPLNDKETMSLFTSTESLKCTAESIASKVGTFAVPEFGTKFVRQMLEQTKPTTFSELVRISGLSHGTDVWINNAQELIANGTTTLREAICTRDDIMLHLIKNGMPSKNAFVIMERVRKGKKLTSEDEALMREHKIPEWYISSCNKIQYMFPKAHAVAYVSTAVKIAWFKVHHPLSFYAAYFTVRADEFNADIMSDAKVNLKEIKKLEGNESVLNAKEKNVLHICQVAREMFARGFEFLPVDIYKSDVQQFIIEDGKLRPPLVAVAGLGGSVAENIKFARDEKEFSSKEDLKNRGKVNKAVLEILKNNGCLSSLPDSEQLDFFSIM